MAILAKPARRVVPARATRRIQGAHRFSRVIHVLIGCGLALGVAIAAAAGLMAYNAYKAGMSDGRRELQNLALVLSDHMDRLSESIAMVQRGVVEQMRSLDVRTPEAFATVMSTQSVSESLKDRIVGLPVVDALVLVDSAGKVVNLSRGWPTPTIDVSDRDYYQALRQPDGIEAFLGAPVRNRSNGALTIYIGQRLNSRDGAFLGIVLCAVQLQSLQEFYARLASEPGRSISLIRNDGILLAHVPVLADKVGTAVPGNPTVRSGSRLPVAEYVRRKDAWDGQDRFTAINRSVHLPVVVTVSQTAATALASWSKQRTSLLVGTGLLEAGILAMVLGGVKLLRGQAQLSHANTERRLSLQAAVEAKLAVSQQREAAAREAYAKDRRFGTALENMSQGLCMFDRENRLLVANGQLATLLGIPWDAMQGGMTLHGFLASAVQPNGFSASQADAFETRLLTLSAARQGASCSLAMQDGRSVAMSFRPMEESDGWVLTCEDVTDRRQAEQRILHMARHDALTNLANRVLLRERIEEAYARTRRGEAFAVLCLDLDHFKTVNDTLGHPVGDALLQDVTARLLRCVRETDTVARIGGDEFVVLQQSDPVPDGATELALRLVEELGLPYEINGHQIVIGTSIGIALAPSDSLDPDELLKHGDLALYRAKSDGGGCHRFFEPDMDVRMQNRRQLEVDLRQALREGEFRLYYQPLVCRQSRSVIAFEALLRWQHPRRGLVGPDQFIGLAEEIGLITAMGEWVLTEACNEAARWPGSIKVAVNLSSHQFARCPALVGAVEAALRDSGLAADRLELEITETVLLQDTDETLQTLHALKRLGVRVSMDDFGTGYSSLSYLQKFPFDKVKIDQSFIRGLGVRHDCAAIVHAISGLCGSLGITTTAEGVETEDQMARLAGEHCQEVQGYLFSPPRPASEIPMLIERLSCEAGELAA